MADISLADGYIATSDLSLLARIDLAANGSRVVILRDNHLILELKPRE